MIFRFIFIDICVIDLNIINLLRLYVVNCKGTVDTFMSVNSDKNIL